MHVKSFSPVIQDQESLFPTTSSGSSPGAKRVQTQTSPLHMLMIVICVDYRIESPLFDLDEYADNQFDSLLKKKENIDIDYLTSVTYGHYHLR